MAIDRVPPSPSPLIQPDRGRAQPQGQPPAPGGGAGDGVDAADDFALAPLDAGEVGMLLDGLGGLDGSAMPGASTMAQAIAAEAVLANDPDAMLMAGSWFVMVRTYAEQRAAWLEQARGQRMPSSLFMADSGENLREGRAPAPLVTEMEPWRFAVYAWGAEQLVLRVLARDAESGTDPRRRGRAVLRLDVMLPGVGRVILQMEPAGGGVILEVGAQQSAAMAHMREMLPRLAALVSRSGLTILRCKLMRELPQLSITRIYPTRNQAAALTPAIFKAMAEVAVLLSQPQPPDDLFFERA